MRTRSTLRAVAMTVSLVLATPAGAQIPVTDIAAIAQLLAQLQQLQEQFQLLKQQLEQAQALYESMNGERGMERLMDGVIRNYLPEDWQALIDAMEDVSATYSQLASEVRAIIESHAILTEAQLEGLDPGDREELQAARKSLALFEAVARQALATTSERFDAIQAFVEAIATAEDQKAILDLQARIASEQTMLANEANKLQVLAQAAQVQERAHRQRQLERRVNGIGRFRELDAMGLGGPAPAP